MGLPPSMCSPIIFPAEYTKAWGWYALPLQLGQEAVIIFFVLSGFVVYLSTQRKQPSFGQAISRPEPSRHISNLSFGLAHWRTECVPTASASQFSFARAFGKHVHAKQDSGFVETWNLVSSISKQLSSLVSCI